MISLNFSATIYSKMSRTPVFIALPGMLIRDENILIVEEVNDEE